LLEVEDLEVSFFRDGEELEAVRGISFSLRKGEALGIVGKSGSGKSTLVQAIIQLIRAHRISGKILFEGEDLLKYSPEAMRAVRGKKIGMIFQNPMSSLNPTMKIGAQIEESLIYHKVAAKKEAKAYALNLLRQMGLPDAEKRYKQYPHELSGGMRQRVLIAIALACNPSLLIADEPTTALDAALQNQILQLLKQRKSHTSLLLISHDLSVIEQVCDRILVLHAGQIVEQGSASRHSYHFLPRFYSINKEPLLEVTHLSKTYSLGNQSLTAVDDASFSIHKGEILGLVGESGSGKSTLGKMLLGLVEPSSGQIFFQGERITTRKKKALCKKMQIIFQDPYSSLNPRMTVGALIAEPLIIHKMKIRVDELLELVGLPPSAKKCLPHELSGGQRQRIAIARALAPSPDFIVCDEPISSLDASMQAQIVNLLLHLQQELGLTYLFISHDLALIRQISTRVAAMHRGAFIEIPCGNQ
jgi:peptide/nickel transport system ATP-binding protein